MFRAQLVGVSLVLTLFAFPADALERRPMQIHEDHPDWTGNLATYQISYFNVCTGWIWVFSDFQPLESVGVSFYTACFGYHHWDPYYDTQFIYTHLGAPSGYGFTGLLSVYAADEEGCTVGSAVATKPWLPADGWNEITWDIPFPDRWALLVTFGIQPNSPVEIATDHPWAGPTGPHGVGICYPTTRVAHSFNYGVPSCTPCPPAPFHLDNGFPVELLWEFSYTCPIESPVSVQSESWGKVKALYR